jgi:hypothetical protein
MISSEEVLRKLTMADPAYLGGLMPPGAGRAASALDARSVALVRLSSSITAGSAGSMLRQRVSDALGAGLGFEEIVATLVALVPTLGVDRIVAVAPDLARALDYDIDAAFEELDPAPTGAMTSVRGNLTGT